METAVRDVDLTKVNLNLLVYLDTLLSERSVTRAAHRLGITQSAMSHNLRQLREIFGDPLLVRAKGGMQPTPRAEQLVIPLRSGLQSLRRTLDGEAAFDPATSTRRFVIAAGDAAGMLLLPPLLERLQSDGPGVDIDVVPFDGRRYATQLETGEVDVAISAFFPDAPSVRMRKLRPASFVCVVRDGHPAVGETLDLATWARLPHVLVSPQGTGGPGIVDRALAKHGLERRVAVRIRYFLAAPLLVARTDLVLTTTRSLAEMFAVDLPVRLIDPPVELPTFSIGLAWHERVAKDPANRWIRAHVAEALKTM
jgi:DNA-binding transcriptional LysR family regulator